MKTGGENRRSRRDFIQTTSGGAVGLLASGLLGTSCRTGPDKPSSPGHAPARPDQGAPGSRPNVVLICTDDLGYGDTACYGAPSYITPNITALANGGTRFTSAYVAAPLCSPSRAALLTGRYPQRFGFEFNAGPPSRCESESLGLPTSENTLADVLKMGGYRTGLVGKWHLGSRPMFHPRQRCFDEFFGFLHDQSIYLDPSDRADVHSVTTSSQRWFPRNRGQYQAIYRDTTVVREAEYLTDAFTREALSFIERSAARPDPFFLYLSYNAPHTPLQVTNHYYRRFPQEPDRRKRIYKAMVSAVDDGIGAVLANLKRLKLEEDTLVILLSDNGCATTSGACSNAPLNGGKLFPFEGGVRVPMIWRLPGRITAGATYNEMVSSMDILPTVASLARVTPASSKHLDGQDLLPHLAGTQPSPPHESLFFRVGDNAAMRRGRHKLVTLNNRRTLLFDLGDDVRERKDLALTRPDRVATLADELHDWEADMSKPLWSGQQTAPFSLKPLGLGDERYHLWT